MAYPKIHGKYKLKIHHGRHQWRGVEFNTRTMSEATADRLFEMGWKHLEKIKKKESPE